VNAVITQKPQTAPQATEIFATVMRIRGYKVPKLSILMIVRNEEANIGPCIESFKPVADEIIVNDTGSTDRTMGVLGSLNVKLICNPWEDSFAKARNQALALATPGNWALWIDADDRLPPSEIEKLDYLKNTGPLCCYCLDIVNTIQGRPIGGRFLQPRMFPVRPDIHWSRRVHETLEPSLRTAGIPRHGRNVQIHHYGYDNPELHKKKAERNIRLALMEKKLMKTDGAFIAAVGDAYFILDCWDIGIRYYKAAMDIRCIIKYGVDFRASLQNNIGIGWQKLGRHNKAIEHFTLALACCPDFIDPMYYRAVSRMHLGDQGGAVRSFKKVIEADLKRMSVVSQAETCKMFAFNYLARIMMDRGQPQAAADVLERFIMLYPQVIDGYRLLIDCYK
jgi:glycosyltransferase involved in cell wall biosynthesis